MIVCQNEVQIIAAFDSISHLLSITSDEILAVRAEKQNTEFEFRKKKFIDLIGIYLYDGSNFITILSGIKNKENIRRRIIPNINFWGNIRVYNDQFINWLLDYCEKSMNKNFLIEEEKRRMFDAQKIMDDFKFTLTNGYHKEYEMHLNRLALFSYMEFIRNGIRKIDQFNGKDIEEVLDLEYYVLKLKALILKDMAKRKKFTMALTELYEKELIKKYKSG